MTVQEENAILKAENKRLHKGWTETNVLLTNAETENVTLRKACEDLKVRLKLMTDERDDYRRRYYGRGK